MAEKYKRNPNTKCLVCRIPIYRRPAEIEKNQKRVFCGLNCYGIYSRKEVPCVVCGKPIMSSLNKKTCSRNCSNKYRTGIKYKIGRPKDKAKTFRVLKSRIIEERGNFCERCKYNKYNILQIHHKNRSRDDNQLENLEILCPNCHCEEHFLENN